MATTDTFKCSVITPERVVFESDASFVAFPAHDGEVGVLRNRAPLVCKMGIGALRIDAPGEKITMFVDGGFAQMVDNCLAILTQQAKAPNELDKPAAEQALVEARAMKITDEAAYHARTDAIQRAQVQIKLAK